MRRILSTGAMGAGLLFAGSAAAHDFFLMPEEFVGTNGSPLIIHATSSSDFPALNVGSPSTRVAGVQAIVADRPAAVEVQEETKSLRLAVTSDTSGMGVVTLQTIWGETDWGPNLMDTYLEEHPFKADDVSTVRRLVKEGSTLQVRSRRLAKTIVCIRVCIPATSVAAGLEVEFVPEFDATGVTPARVQLLRDGRPLAKHPVVLRAAHDERMNLVSDDSGWVSLPPAVSGPIMLVAVTIDPPTEPGARFTTNNATLTLETREGRLGK